MADINKAKIEKKEKSSRATIAGTAGVAAGAMAGAGGAFAAGKIPFGNDEINENEPVAQESVSKEILPPEDTLPGQPVVESKIETPTASNDTEVTNVPEIEPEEQIVTEEIIEEQIVEQPTNTPNLAANLGDDLQEGQPAGQEPTTDPVVELAIDEEETVAVEPAPEEPQIVPDNLVQPVEPEETPQPELSTQVVESQNISNDDLGLLGKAAMGAAGIFVGKEQAHNIGKTLDTLAGIVPGVAGINEKAGDAIDVVENIVHAAQGKESSVSVEKIIPTVIEHIPTVITGEEKAHEALLGVVQEVIPESGEIIEQFTGSTKVTETAEVVVADTQEDVAIADAADVIAEVPSEIPSDEATVSTDDSYMNDYLTENQSVVDNTDTLF